MELRVSLVLSELQLPQTRNVSMPVFFCGGGFVKEFTAKAYFLVVANVGVDVVLVFSLERAKSLVTEE